MRKEKYLQIPLSKRTIWSHLWFAYSLLNQGGLTSVSFLRLSSPALQCISWISVFPLLQPLQGLLWFGPCMGTSCQLSCFKWHSFCADDSTEQLTRVLKVRERSALLPESLVGLQLGWLLTPMERSAYQFSDQLLNFMLPFLFEGDSGTSITFSVINNKNKIPEFNSFACLSSLKLFVTFPHCLDLLVQRNRHSLL